MVELRRKLVTHKEATLRSEKTIEQAHHGMRRVLLSHPSSAGQQTPAPAESFSATQGKVI
jgi:hypothetical protein